MLSRTNEIWSHLMLNWLSTLVSMTLTTKDVASVLADAADQVMDYHDDDYDDEEVPARSAVKTFTVLKSPAIASLKGEIDAK